MSTATESRVPAAAEPSDHRVLLMEELYQRYGTGTRSRQFRFWRKKYAWVLIVGGAKCLKRGIDILGSLVLMVLLMPIFLVVAAIIKLDGGPILFWQMRVGRWGREFPFPKLRSMVANAEQLKDKMLEQERIAKILAKAEKKEPLTGDERGHLIDWLATNDHAKPIIAKLQQGEALQKDDLRLLITFKGKKDPRITWIGKFIRRGSIDELPQLWCVLKGDMSLVGPRPPVPREVAQYTLADRRRLDAIPGLTCIWQVSGRGDIPFPKQVELDVQYIHSQSLWVDIVLLLKTVPAVFLGKGAY